MMAVRNFFLLKLSLFTVCILACFGCFQKSSTDAQPVSFDPSVATQRRQRACESAAKKALGVTAEVLSCGQLTRPGVTETLAAVKLSGFKDTEMGMPVSKFAILREEKPEWAIELIADQQPVRNSAGYIGADNIDDSYGYSRYRISFSGGESAKEPLSLLVRFISPNGETDAWSLEIDWNPATQRFQEYSEADTPIGFVLENKNPKHFNRKKR